MNATVDYSQFGQVHAFAGVIDMTAGGVYQVPLDGGLSLDVLVEGMDRRTDRTWPVLVFFGGAIDRAGKTGPFFSGRSMANAARLPLLAICDPALGLDSGLRMGWYAGVPGCPDLPRRIGRFLDDFSAAYGQLILIGGSAGGFGILNVLQHMSCRAKAIVWNPQTRIADYYPSASRAYAALFTGHEQPLQPPQLQAVFDAAGLGSDVRQASAGSNAVLYCQNQSDNHVQKHLMPFLAHGAWERLSPAIQVCPARGVTVCIGNWGEGHAALPGDTLLQAITDITAGRTLQTVADSIAAAYPLAVHSAQDQSGSAP